jgi:hypothetical protein
MKFFNSVDVNDNVIDYSNAQLASVEMMVFSTDAAELYSFSASDYVGAKFLIRMTSPLGNSIREILAVHDGEEGYLTEYGVVASASELELDTFDFTVSTNNGILSVSPTSEDSREIKLFINLIK